MPVNPGSTHEHDTPIPDPTNPSSNPSHSPPHRIPYRNPTTEKIYHHGRCFCGKVTFTVHRPMPVGSKYCHCKTCQRLHGAVVQWATIFHKSSISFTAGHTNLRFLYHNGDDGTICDWSYKLPCKAIASCCGAPIMDEGRTMLMMFPALIDLSDEERLAWRTQPGEGGQLPCHIFYKDRSLDVNDGLKKYEGLDGSSRVMDEGGGYRGDEEGEFEGEGSSGAYGN
ncbi:Mss4-like protein [Peziza echinospora]|nr:Mss4-like protein [Peziza echinospora]